MITPTVMRRVLTKLEAEDQRIVARGEPGQPAHDSAQMSLLTNRRFQADGVMIARLARALNAETPAFAPNSQGASSTGCDDQHTTAPGV